MRRQRSFRVVAIVALTFAVIGVSIGFAAYNQNLTINLGGTVTPEDTFTMQFSKSGSELTTSDVTEAAGTTAGATGTATFSGDGYTVSTVSAKFKKPGDVVVLNFYAVNTSIYDAYLKSITLGAASATCTGAGVPEATRNQVCSNMSISVKVGELNAVTYVTGSMTDISANNAIDAVSDSDYSSLPITITLTYGGNMAVDSSLTVEFGSVTLGYSTSNS